MRDQFKVSATALTSATHAAGRMTDWAYRNTCIKVSVRGFRSSEPGGMAAHEMSRVFPQIVGFPRNVFARHVAADPHAPVEGVRAFTFCVGLGCATPATDVPAAQATVYVGYQRMQVVR